MDKITTAQRLGQKKKTRTKLVPVRGGGFFNRFVRVIK